MKIFVTGAEGFIGSHLVEYLIKKNHKVTSLVHYNSFGNKGWLENINSIAKKKNNICFGDVRDQDLLKKQTEKHDAIIHLAALIAIPYSYEAPKSYIETNIIGTYNVLQVSKLNNIKKTIITSTSEIYGRSKKFPISEDAIVDPRSPYSATKIAADQLALSYYYSYKLPVTIIRPFNTFGPRQSLRAVIPTIINQIIDGKKIIKLGNLNTKRNYNFVEDIVRGFEMAVRSKINTNGQIINLGSNFEVSVKKLVELISKIENQKIEINSEKMRVRPKNSEVLRLTASNLKAKKLLNWSPKINNEKTFSKSLHKTIVWFKNNRLNYLKQSDEYII
ncbi:GDP-mannose 4,6-dehydratase [Candidatus Pelagibacter sp.]|nr:GDP-mannose 4,6-dehydratase [Candidatus Pelagibacter sp.]|tara:strand:- start:903 stop:1901 length:999 start_codon:yes stop_codon:yes gene_type:complete